MMEFQLLTLHALNYHRLIYSRNRQVRATISHLIENICATVLLCLGKLPYQHVSRCSQLIRGLVPSLALHLWSAQIFFMSTHHRQIELHSFMTYLPLFLGGGLPQTNIAEH